MIVLMLRVRLLVLSSGFFQKSSLVSFSWNYREDQCIRNHNMLCVARLSAGMRRLFRSGCGGRMGHARWLEAIHWVRSSTGLHNIGQHVFSWNVARGNNVSPGPERFASRVPGDRAVSLGWYRGIPQPSAISEWPTQFHAQEHRCALLGEVSVRSHCSILRAGMESNRFRKSKRVSSSGSTPHKDKKKNR